MFSEAFGLFLRNPVIGLPNIIAALLSAASYKVMSASIDLDTLKSNNFSGMDSIPAGLAMSLSFFFLFLIISLLLEPLIQSVTALLCVNTLSGSGSNLQQSVRKSLHFYWRLMGVMAFKFFLFLGIGLASLAAMYPMLKKAFSTHDLSTMDISAFALIIVLFFLLALIYIVLHFMMLPIEPLLVYKDLPLGEAIPKGFRFGVRKFFPLLGVSLLMAIGASFISYIISLLIGNSAGISAIATSFLSAFLSLYIMYMLRDEDKLHAVLSELGSVNTNVDGNDASSHHQDSILSDNASDIRHGGIDIDFDDDVDVDVDVGDNDNDNGGDDSSKQTN